MSKQNGAFEIRGKDYFSNIDKKINHPWLVSDGCIKGSGILNINSDNVPIPGRNPYPGIFFTTSYRYANILWNRLTK